VLGPPTRNPVDAKEYGASNGKLPLLLRLRKKVLLLTLHLREKEFIATSSTSARVCTPGLMF
jgi:hypothetical protein